MLCYAAYYHEVSEKDEDMKMTEVESAPSQQHRSIELFLFFLSELTIIHFYYQKSYFDMLKLIYSIDTEFL